MNEAGQLHWTSVRQTVTSRREVEFCYDPVLGLSDIDFHQVNEGNWQYMKSPAPDALAVLRVAPDLTIEQLQSAIALLNTRGGYKEVLIAVQP